MTPSRLIILICVPLIWVSGFLIGCLVGYWHLRREINKADDTLLAWARAAKKSQEILNEQEAIFKTVKWEDYKT